LPWQYCFPFAIKNKTRPHRRTLQIPPGYDLLSWDYIKASNKFILTVKKDTDRNKKFDDEDEVASFQVDLDKDA
jgi:hypothetical protein